jgi:hypothetical protein
MPFSSSLFSALDFCTTVFTGHLGYYSFVSFEIFLTCLSNTDAMLSRSKTSGTLRGSFSSKCKPAAFVLRRTLPAINLHSIQLCPARRICFSSRHASVSRPGYFSSLSALTLHQDPGIFCQPCCDTCVSPLIRYYHQGRSFLSRCQSVHKGKIAPILIVGSLPRESPFQTNLII